MDIEKLIETAKVCCGDIKSEDCSEQCIDPRDNRGTGEDRFCRQWLIHDLYTALSTLKAENEKLRAELEQVKEDWSTAANGLMLMQKKLNKVYRMLYDPLIIVDGGHLRPVKNTSRQQVYKKLVDLQVEMGINRGFPWGEMRMEKKED